MIRYRVLALALAGGRTPCRMRNLEDTATLEVNLNSGRPDQIRIHLASIDHPLVGDPLYGLTGQPLEISPACPAMEDISCTPNI
jgi:23S rRNA-/tRNA-specific pseudouridylate synthase